MEKEYKEKLPNGTNLTIKVSVSTENYNREDYRDIFSSFASYTLQFYLNELASAVNAD